MLGKLGWLPCACLPAIPSPGLSPALPAMHSLYPCLPCHTPHPARPAAERRHQGGDGEGRQDGGRDCRQVERQPSWQAGSQGGGGEPLSASLPVQALAAKRAGGTPLPALRHALPTNTAAGRPSCAGRSCSDWTPPPPPPPAAASCAPAHSHNTQHSTAPVTAGALLFTQVWAKNAQLKLRGDACNCDLAAAELQVL